MTTQETKPIKCAYCYKEIKPSEVYWDCIFSPNWKANRGRSPNRPYCNKGCHSYDQMAHEG